MKSWNILRQCDEEVRNNKITSRMLANEQRKYNGYFFLLLFCCAMSSIFFTIPNLVSGVLFLAQSATLYVSFLFRFFFFFLFALQIAHTFDCSHSHLSGHYSNTSCSFQILVRSIKKMHVNEHTKLPTFQFSGIRRICLMSSFFSFHQMSGRLHWTDWKNSIF